MNDNDTLQRHLCRDKVPENLYGMLRGVESLSEWYSSQNTHKIAFVVKLSIN